MKACVISLGCPKNLTDSEVLMGQLSCGGYEIITDHKKADLIVVNTCAFLQAAREESIATIKDAIKDKKPGAKVYVAGCLPKLHSRLRLKIDGIIDSVDIFDSHTPRIKATNPWTAYVKISEGCNNRCSYCLIPKIRGPLKNRKVADILKETRELSKKGVKEIIFVAQDTSAHPKFEEILRKTAKIKDIKWIRIMYTHPKHLSKNLIKTIEKEAKICKYIDLPIQHICDNILKKMRRGVSSSDVQGLIETLRNEIKGLVLRTSLIVGFPGEKEGEFLKLADFIKKMQFERLGIFKYSKEEGTSAAKLRGQIPEKVKELSFHKLMALQNQISKGLNKKLIGKTFEVLIEKIGKNFCIGRTYMDAPDIDGSVKIFNPNLKLGRFVKAKIVKASAYDLEAVLT